MVSKHQKAFKTVSKSHGGGGQYPAVQQHNSDITLSQSSSDSDPSIPNVDLSSNEQKYITIGTFNIHHGVDRQNNESLDVLIDEIKASGAQIIALQEVDRNHFRSGFKDQVKEIAKALSFSYAYGETINILGVKYGNAFVSAYPIIEEENIVLPTASWERRGLLKAKIDLGDHIYRFYTTHLGLSAKEREEQIAVINREISDSPFRVILMGDFNAQPEYREMKKIHSGLQDTAHKVAQEQLFTFAYNSIIPNIRIDYIYTSKDVAILKHWVNPSSISDHNMVLARIDLSSGE
jgi:endonuclease/exonuclease/phosphatase family metal-dependent hydrolase